VLDKTKADRLAVSHDAFGNHNHGQIIRFRFCKKKL